MLRNKVAIVTGSGRGIGAEIAKLMAAHGARVIVNDVGTSGEGVGRDGSGSVLSIWKTRLGRRPNVSKHALSICARNELRKKSRKNWLGAATTRSSSTNARLVLGPNQSSKRSFPTLSTSFVRRADTISISSVVTSRPSPARGFSPNAPS